MPSALAICQSGWPAASTPWQAAQFAAKISRPFGGAGTGEAILMDVGLTSTGEDEQAVNTKGASTSTAIATAQPPDRARKKLNPRADSNASA